MLFREFAIDPSQINDISHLRLIESRFGYEKGCLISAFPSDWLRHAITRLQTQQTTQIDKLTELLRYIAQKSVHKYGRQFAYKNWIESALESNAEKPFHRIIEPSQPRIATHLRSIFDLEDTDFTLTANCNRTATQISEASQELIVDAEKISIVDAYADPSNKGYLKTIIAIASKSRKTQVELVIYSEEDRQSVDFEVRKVSLQGLSDQLSTNIKLTWCFLSDKGTGFIHPRALFTAKGGVNFDRGFQEPSDFAQKAAPNLLSILTKTQLEKFTLDYNYSQINEPLEISHLWQSE